MSYWRLFYHVVWATKERLPLIELGWEADLYGYIWGKATALDCVVHAIGGMPEHVHVVLSIPPKLAVATIVGKLKGSSSHHINGRLISDGLFDWQNEYGVVSFSESALPKIVEYVTTQKIHHASNSLNDKLEST